jgi:hypothetical protein
MWKKTREQKSKPTTHDQGGSVRLPLFLLMVMRLEETAK